MSHCLLDVDSRFRRKGTWREGVGGCRCEVRELVSLFTKVQSRSRTTRWEGRRDNVSSAHSRELVRAPSPTSLHSFSCLPHTHQNQNKLLTETQRKTPPPPPPLPPPLLLPRNTIQMHPPNLPSPNPGPPKIHFASHLQKSRSNRKLHQTLRHNIKPHHALPNRDMRLSTINHGPG